MDFRLAAPQSLAYLNSWEQSLNSAEKPNPLIRSTALARRWGLHPETVASYTAQGMLKPALRCRGSILYALADVERIEAGGKGHDVDISALTFEARTSPKQLLFRIELAKDCVELAKSHGHVHNLGEAAPSLRGAVAALIEQVNGGDGAHDLPEPTIGPRGSFGVDLNDKHAGVGLMCIAYAALVHCLMSGESRATLTDLGPNMRAKFDAVLGNLKGAIEPAQLQS